MATDTGEGVPQLLEEWKLCDRCDVGYVKARLLEQKGLLVCSGCYDLTDHQDEDDS